MFNPKEIMIEHFTKELEKAYWWNYGLTDPPYGEIVAWTGRLALENIANTDILYHDLDHTMMVTLAGQAILQGKHLCEGGVNPRDWLHFMMAVLCHDIGYIKGVCQDDKDNVIATGIDGKTTTIPSGGTDATLTPYHVDRSKLFIHERFNEQKLRDIDAELVTSFIEMTRFPVPDDDLHKDTKGYGGLVRAADLIGQLGDPGYLRKVPALFYEFEELGVNTRFGYKNPEDMRKTYAKFYWNVISPYVQDALRYLRVTQEGKQWIANLHSHVFEIEHSSAQSLS